MTTTKRSPVARQFLNKVPEVTIYFWVIKVLCTTVGESAADFLNVNLNFGLTGTSVVTGVLLVDRAGLPVRAHRYVPSGVLADAWRWSASSARWSPTTSPTTWACRSKRAP